MMELMLRWPARGVVKGSKSVNSVEWPRVERSKIAAVAFMD